MSIREKVARAIEPSWFGESGKVLCNYPDQDKNYQERARKQADAAITAFLEAAAEQGWHMRPDVATEQMLFKAHKAQVWSPELGPSIGASQDRAKWQAMNAAAPKFEWDK